jgi:hypothetical protein
MYVPVDAPAAARAAIALAASRPWRLVELSLVYLPDAARAGEEGERHRSTNPQQLGRPDDRHANCAAGCAVIARTGAAEARGREAAIGPAPKVDQPSRAVAARAIDVQLDAAAADVADCLEWKLAKHGANRNAAASSESLGQQ